MESLYPESTSPGLGGEAKVLDDRSAKADEGLGGKRETLSFAKQETPAAFEFALAQRQRAERSLGQFFLGDPARENADAEAEFDQFFDGLHVSQLDGRGDDDFFGVKVFVDHFVKVTGPGVEDETLPRNFFAIDLSGSRPWM